MRRLLLRMGATANSSLLIAGITAASPTILFLSTNLLPETLFALLTTAALLALLRSAPSSPVFLPASPRSPGSRASR